MEKVWVRKANAREPLDIAAALYEFIPEDGIAAQALEDILPEGSAKKTIQRLGIHNIVAALPQWLEKLDGDIFRKRTLEELQDAIKAEGVARKERTSSSFIQGEG